MKLVFYVAKSNMQCFSDNCNCNGVLKQGNMNNTVSFRPRGVLARTLYDKQKHDEYLSQFNKREVSFENYF